MGFDKKGALADLKRYDVVVVQTKLVRVYATDPASAQAYAQQPEVFRHAEPIERRIERLEEV